MLRFSDRSLGSINAAWKNTKPTSCAQNQFTSGSDPGYYPSQWMLPDPVSTLIQTSKMYLNLRFDGSKSKQHIASFWGPVPPRSLTSDIHYGY